MASDSLGISGLGPGKVLDGKYEILTRLGGGGMGDVFKAQHVHLNVFRCIKVMKEAMLADEGYRARFLREARMATQIHHPNIAVVHDFFIGDGSGGDRTGRSRCRWRPTSRCRCWGDSITFTAAAFCTATSRPTT